MDLRTWIRMQHDDVCGRLRSQVLGRVPRERWNDRPDPGSGSVAWVLWHATRHQDVAVNAVVRGVDDVLSGGRWVDDLGVAGFAPGTGLSEGDDIDAAAALSLDAIDAYAGAVWAQTAAWLDDVTADELDRVPDSTAALHRLGIDAQEYAWLQRMWEAKPVSFHVAWEAIGHGLNHLGELTQIRNRLGYGGF
jgi:hypothetical protein